MNQRRTENLRGLAAIVVCWFHFVHFNSYIPDGALRMSGAEGYLGVAVFLRHFRLRHSVCQALPNYEIKHYNTFLLMRLLRLTIRAAYLPYRLVEVPAQRWSSTVRYRSPKPSESGESELGVQSAL